LDKNVTETPFSTQKLGIMTHAYFPCYVGVVGRRIMLQGQTLGEKSQKQKRWGDVSQMVQYLPRNRRT
jgi:hypothetical protein